MTLSAIIMGSIGISASFIPREMLVYIDLPTNQPMPILIQVMGAMYLAFSMINWFAKNNLIGGIYSKPIAIGNFTHFLIASLALAKGINTETGPSVLWAITIIYIIFALLFGYIVFGNPIKRDDAI